MSRPHKVDLPPIKSNAVEITGIKIQSGDASDLGKIILAILDSNADESTKIAALSTLEKATKISDFSLNNTHVMMRDSK